MLNVACMFPFRRDKYEKDLRKYWVDVETTGSYEAENEEQFVDATVGEGDAGDSIDLGLPAPDRNAVVNSPGEEPDEDTDEDVSEDDGSGSSRHKVPSKNDVEREHALEVGLMIHFMLKKFLYNMFYPISISTVSGKAVENVGPVIANLLRVQSKMETARDKLKALDQTDDVKKNLRCASIKIFNIDQHCDGII